MQFKLLHACEDNLLQLGRLIFKKMLVRHTVSPLGKWPAPNWINQRAKVSQLLQPSSCMLPLKSKARDMMRREKITRALWLYVSVCVETNLTFPMYFIYY
jgi:hypothetical protein